MKSLNQAGMKFFELLERSVICQSIITVLMVSIICVLAVLNRPIPEIIQAITYTVVGFWFGTKSQYAISSYNK